MLLKGLAPVLAERPRILILGSMPSVASLEKQQYYGHPRNAFWNLIARLNAFEWSEDYAVNLAAAKKAGICIWDVIGECERPGSLDSAIVKGSERINPILELLLLNQGIQHIGLNGGTAAKLFRRHCMPELDIQKYSTFDLPSTSPANAKMSFEEKCVHWQPLFAVA